MFDSPGISPQNMRTTDRPTSARRNRRLFFGDVEATKPAMPSRRKRAVNA